MQYIFWGKCVCNRSLHLKSCKLKKKENIRNKKSHPCIVTLKSFSFCVTVKQAISGEKMLIRRWNKRGFDVYCKEYIFVIFVMFVCLVYVCCFVSSPASFNQVHLFFSFQLYFFPHVHFSTKRNSGRVTDNSDWKEEIVWTGLPWIWVSATYILCLSGWLLNTTLDFIT